MKRFLLGLISLTAFGLTPLSSCVTSAQTDERFIQGKWRLEGEHPKDKSGRSRVWFLEWTFADGKFVQKPVIRRFSRRENTASSNKQKTI